ncbi:hypothetical protein [Pseudidiomarina aestuarii]|uniref:hypothetical protein n=1 Tax=Pseudidiomarina aestuarii TaxID=624146 RepID=UPI003A981032
MKHILLVLVVIVAVVISPPSSAWQVVEVSQGGSQLDQARQFLNNYPTEPFMNEQRLSQFAEARSQKDIMRLNGYNRLQTEARALERNIEQRLRAARDALEVGDIARFNHERTVLNVVEQNMQDVAQRWSQMTPMERYRETQAQQADVATEQVEISNPGPEVASNAPPPPTSPTFLGMSLTTPVVVTGVAVAVGTAAAITNNGDDTTDTTGGNN